MSNKWSWGALVPRSLLSRMILLLLLAILLSQTILTGIWMQQIQKRELEGMLSTTRNLAMSAASTVNFFKSLPLQYRHIALDQLRNMGAAASSSRSTRKRSTSTPSPTASARRRCWRRFREC